MSCELLEEVKSFVAEFWGEPKNRLAAENGMHPPNDSVVLK
jgi:hypothetical protein